MDKVTKFSRDDDEYNSIPEEADGLFGDDALFDTGRAVIARYRRINDGVEIARDIEGAKIVDLLVLPWSRRGRVTKERLMKGNVFAPVLRISDWRSVRFIPRFGEDTSGRQLGLLEKWQQVDRALDEKENIWIRD
ncbi:hypothetical protein PHISCL_04227 [Aspergillus sclerotialis]|uniref:Uncharacterized protein n=1 Tax=Aspergillus sclerotialis TaxID=2070753 RepID=A0A3A2ZJM9_9EURO|nr:hypothetical protein PHISCL_04227 [Aspergillus sclerotialis]